MPIWKPIVGTGFSKNDFNTYCHTLQWAAWRPELLVLHNTAIPSLQDKPHGFNQQSMQNFVEYYRDKQQWSAGPHLFVDDHQIWVFTPLTTPGVHSPSWNNTSLGIEMLGDYNRESFTDGRGRQVRINTVSAMATLCLILSISPDSIRLHKEDIETTHDCPGRNVIKNEVIMQVKQSI